MCYYPLILELVTYILQFLLIHKPHILKLIHKHLLLMSQIPIKTPKTDYAILLYSTTGLLYDHHLR